MEFVECGTLRRFWVASNVSRCQQLTRCKAPCAAKTRVNLKGVLFLTCSCLHCHATFVPNRRLILTLLTNSQTFLITCRFVSNGQFLYHPNYKLRLMTCGIMEVKPEISANINQTKYSNFISLWVVSCKHYLTVLTFVFIYYHRNNPKFTNQPAQVTYVPVRPRTLVWRVLHLLREHGGHGHLRLWTHVSVLHLRPQAQEDVQCLLSNLQAANQRHYQDLSEHIRERKASLTATQSQRQGKKCHISGNVSSGTFL